MDASTSTNNEDDIVGDPTVAEEEKRNLQDSTVQLGDVTQNRGQHVTAPTGGGSSSTARPSSSQLDLNPVQRLMSALGSPPLAGAGYNSLTYNVPAQSGHNQNVPLDQTNPLMMAGLFSQPNMQLALMLQLQQQQQQQLQQQNNIAGLTGNLLSNNNNSTVPVEALMGIYQRYQTVPPSHTQNSVNAGGNNHLLAQLLAGNNNVFASNNLAGAQLPQQQQQFMFQPSSLYASPSAQIPSAFAYPLSTPGGGEFATGAAAGTSQELLQQQYQQQGDIDSDRPPPQTLTNRPPVCLYIDLDESVLSEYQVLLRKQIELFETLPADNSAGVQGRNRPILVGQVGIRCRHCAHIPRASGRLTKGSVYYSRTLDGLYQVCQNLSKVHLQDTCQSIPDETKLRLRELQQINKRTSGRKEYWLYGLNELGVYQDRGILRFRPLGYDPVNNVMSSTTTPK